MSLRRTKVFHPLQEAIVRESLSHSMLIQVLYRLGSKARKEQWQIFENEVVEKKGKRKPNPRPLVDESTDLTTMPEPRPMSL